MDKSSLMSLVEHSATEFPELLLQLLKPVLRRWVLRISLASTDGFGRMANTWADLACVAYG